MRKKYTDFVFNFWGDKKPVAEDLIEWIISSWYEPNVISKDMIINSLKKTAISNKIDGTEIIYLNSLKNSLRTLIFHKLNLKNKLNINYKRKILYLIYIIEI